MKSRRNVSPSAGRKKIAVRVAAAKVEVAVIVRRVRAAELRQVPAHRDAEVRGNSAAVAVDRVMAVRARGAAAKVGTAVVEAVADLIVVRRVPTRKHRRKSSK